MWESEIGLTVILATWILYELYGRHALTKIAEWSAYIRLFGGAALIVWVWWYARETPEGFQDTVEFAKQWIKDSGSAPGKYTGGSLFPAASTTKEKRNVSQLMKKKVAASQKWLCAYCGELLDETYEVDHQVALFQGGDNSFENLKAVHPQCHRKKTVEERL